MAITVRCPGENGPEKLVLVPLNIHDQPPALLIDPVATDGTKLTGWWLDAGEEGSTTNAYYQQVDQPTPAPFDETRDRVRVGRCSIGRCEMPDEFTSPACLA